MSEQDNKDPWLGAQSVHQSGNKESEEQGMKAGWEREAIQDLLQSHLKEQRRSRRWGLFFKGLMFVYLFALLFILLPDDGAELSGEGKAHTALVEIQGVIADDAEANADTIITGLRAAFKNKHSKAVVLRINSPGGSPVQSGYVYDEIIRLREKYTDKLLYVVITDMCASGGYYIASAADYIYADKASIVGSIGVVMNGFGFVGAMEKLGIERRMMTAGENKGMLDPFSDVKIEEKQHIEEMLSTIHQQFINVVKEGRGERLVANPDIFSGLIWTGEQSVELGLIDGLGSSSYVARDVIGAEKIVDYTVRAPYFERFAERIGMTMVRVLGQSGMNLF